jgi:negative regulator of flagellin synthesis FlgM
MPEKINGQGFRPTDAAGTRRTESAKPARVHADSTAGSTPSAGDTVNLTRSGVLLNRLGEVLQRLPVVDVERVRAIKEALESGSYEVDAEAVADSMLRSERELDS